MPDLPELNPVVHGKLRLALMSLLAGVEEAGYVAVEKKFVARKPQTIYRLTEAGRGALVEYVQALKALLGGAM